MFQVHRNSPSIVQVRTLLGVTVLALASASVSASEIPVFNLSIQQGSFSPALVEVPAGKKIKLHVKNEGHGAEEFESSDLNREKLIAPGASADIFIGPLQPGAYKFFGEFHPETAQGQIIAK